MMSSEPLQGRLHDEQQPAFGATTLVVQAHPDDEVYTTGAAITAAHAAGSAVRLRLFTGGEVHGAGVSETDLADARHRKEQMLTRSAGLLGIDDWAYLTEPARWLDTPDMPERTIAAAPLEDLADAVVAAIEQLRPDVVLTVGADGVTGHPDHVACHRAVALAIGRTTHRPSSVLGACVEGNSISRARQHAHATYGQDVGPSGVRGVTPGSGTVIVQGPADAEQRRRDALDVYAPGLGTLPASQLAAAGFGGGDGVLLRLVFDQAGWGTDRFTPMYPQQ